MSLFLERLRHIQDIGAVASSSRFLSEKMVDLAVVESQAAIAEIGPGNGVFTKRIKKKLQPHQSFFTIEKDAQFYGHMETDFPDISHYNVCASEIAMCMEKEHISGLDCIISSLPWALFDDDLQDKIMGAIYESLAPGGTLLTFSYIQSRYLDHGKSCEQKLNHYFSRVEKSDIVWLNLPPAFVYICKK